MTIEIKVQDEVKVFESVFDAQDFVATRVLEWFTSNTTIPLTISLTKIEDRGPPTLGISVEDKLDIKERLGPN